jgi:hypothetical protein
VEPSETSPRIFSLDEARALLPEVKALTADAVRRVEALTASRRRRNATGASSEALEAIIGEWGRAMQALGLEAKGLWLVDFDNGNGYYCWCYPEETVSHFHEYDGGFRGRMKIV